MYIIVDTNCDPVPVRGYDEQCTFYKESDAMDVLQVLLDRIGPDFKVMHIT